MKGAIIGDIVGSRFEFNNYRSKEFELFTGRCFVTDDSIMTIAVAKAIMVTEVQIKSLEYGADTDEAYDQTLADHTVKYMREIGQKYPNCGYGGRFAQWIFSKDPNPYNSYGNGAAMRISPAGFVATSLDEAIRLSKVITAVTHNYPEGLKGAEATVVAIYMAKTGSSKNEIRNKILQNYYSLDFTIDEIRPSYRFNETCQETAP